MAEIDNMDIVIKSFVFRSIKEFWHGQYNEYYEPVDSLLWLSLMLRLENELKVCVKS